MKVHQPGATRGVIRVTVVDDDEVVRQVLRQGIQSISGFTCVGCYASGPEALAGISRVPGDLVLMDIRMPGMSGIECTRQIKVRWPKIRVLVITGMPEGQVLFEAMAAGADGFLYKPYRPAEFAQALHEVCRGVPPLAEKARRLVFEQFRAAGPGTPNDHLLTEREQEIMVLVRRGRTDKEIAQVFGVAPCTIQSHLQHIFRKLNAHTRQEAVFRFWGVK